MVSRVKSINLVGVCLLLSSGYVFGQQSLFNSFPAPRNAFRGQFQTTTAQTPTSPSSLFQSQFGNFDSFFESSTAAHRQSSAQSIIDQPAPQTTAPPPSTTTKKKRRRQNKQQGQNRGRGPSGQRERRRQSGQRRQRGQRRLRIKSTVVPTVPPAIAATRPPPTSTTVRSTTRAQPPTTTSTARSTSRAQPPPINADRFAGRSQSFINPNQFESFTVRTSLEQAPRPPPSPNQQDGRFPSTEQIVDIRREAREFISTDDEWLPNLVQLVFHSCVGGCDGCINFEERDNIGLVDTYATVRELRTRTEGRLLSLADFVVLMGTEAAEIGLQKSEEPRSKLPTIPFHPGRETCSDPDNYRLHHQFPQGDSIDGVEFLMNEFGYTERAQAIALLGAHSLGVCRPENLGFDGRWDNTPLVLDNHYYKSLTETDVWTAVPISGSFQWNSSETDGPMMLHADMALLHSFQVGAGKRPSCTRSSFCNRSKDSGRVSIYAHSFIVWVRDFIPAFLQMVDKKPAAIQ